MSADKKVHHILTVTGYSKNSFDEAAKNAVEEAWENHHEEFEEFVSFEVVNMGGDIVMVDGYPRLQYCVTVAISAIHKPHHH